MRVDCSQFDVWNRYGSGKNAINVSILAIIRGNDLILRMRVRGGEMSLVHPFLHSKVVSDFVVWETMCPTFINGSLYIQILDIKLI